MEQGPRGTSVTMLSENRNKGTLSIPQALREGKGLVCESNLHQL